MSDWIQEREVIPTPEAPASIDESLRGIRFWKLEARSSIHGISTFIPLVYVHNPYNEWFGCSPRLVGIRNIPDLAQGLG